jgi:hypothetical protein
MDRWMNGRMVGKKTHKLSCVRWHMAVVLYVVLRTLSPMSLHPIYILHPTRSYTTDPFWFVVLYELVIILFVVRFSIPSLQNELRRLQGRACAAGEHPAVR